MPSGGPAGFAPWPRRTANDAGTDTENLSETVFRKILDRVQRGDWPVGAELPSERALIREFAVSRVPLREAISRLRALGVLETRRGSGTRVRRVDADTLARLMPLLVTLEGPETFAQVFELRLALESRTAFLAAQRRSDGDARDLAALAGRLRKGLENGLEKGVETDLAFHVRVAEATRNPLFGVLMRALAEIVRRGQVLSCKDDPHRRRRAVESHEAIAEAIRSGDPERARVEMEAHLRYSASRFDSDSPSQGGPA